MTTNPHLERKIDELIAQGVTYSELVAMLADKDVRIVELESEVARKDEALEMFADPENWFAPFESWESWEWEGDVHPVELARAALGGE